MNINFKESIRECTSCQFCAAVCPKDAISINLNEDGFYRPYVDNDKCIDCGLCIKQCYKFDSNIKCTKPTDDIELYAAYAKDSTLVSKTTSGGIADILAKQLIKQGYICIGVKYDTARNIAVGKCASNSEETDDFRGSKYIQSYSIDALKTFVKKARDQKYAVFGLPCQIYAVSKWLSLRGIRDQHILIDLYCHGCPSIFSWQKYIDYVKAETKGNRVSDATFRSKVKGWGNFYVVVVVEGVMKPFVSKIRKDYFYDLFFSDKILNDSCYDCKLRSSLEYTDIRLGDFWGHAYVMNHTGISAITICSENGTELYHSIANDINSTRRNFSEFYPYQSFGRDYKIDKLLREQLLKALRDKTQTIQSAVNILHSNMTLRQRMIHQVKLLVKLFPNDFISSLKALYYRLNRRN